MTFRAEGSGAWSSGNLGLGGHMFAERDPQGMTHSRRFSGRVTTVACAALLASSLAVTANAAPVASASAASPSKAPVAKATKTVKVERRNRTRGISQWETSTPSRAERTRAVRPELKLADVPWAIVSVRDPLAAPQSDGPYASTDANHRAALSFVDPQFSDARSGWAKWSAPTGGFPGSSGGGVPDGFSDLLCALAGIGCDSDDAPDVDVDLHLWINASAGHDYLAVCRVKFDDSAGALAIVPDGAPSMTVQLDHTGRGSTTVSFLVDTSGEGWHGVAIASDEAWSSTGCTIDEF